jgi:hypothetical protein
MPYSLEQIAQVCHEATAGYQRAAYEKYPHLPWLQVTYETRECTIQGVQNVLDGLTAQECHEAWIVQRKGMGWRYGRIKDEFAKRHPCMVPYNKLPVHQRRKNEIFAAVVQAMTKELES